MILVVLVLGLGLPLAIVLFRWATLCIRPSQLSAFVRLSDRSQPEKRAPPTISLALFGFDSVMNCSFILWRGPFAS
jgi:hypothetical protein